MNFGKGGFRIFRIFGIDIIIDWSWIFIFLLVTWSLAMGVFPQWHPYWSAGLSWSVAVAAALLFFGSILLHELAHSLVAKARGLPVHKIVLFLFGGVSNLEREPQSAGVEFVMAVVGPLTSIILGVIFSFLGALSAGGVGAVVNETQRAVSRMSPFATLLLWLGPINILIGIFNLIPGFPLDGGRILRSAIWGVTKNLRRATIMAARVGQGIAWLFIIAGIAMVFGVRIPFFGSGFISGLWLAFIGWFLNNAAIQSSQQVLIEDVLEDVPVSRLMRPNLHTVPPGTSVGSLVHDWIMGTDEHAFVVMEGDRMEGIVCLEDVRKLPRDQWDSTEIRAIMTPADQVISAAPAEHVADALRQLTGSDIRQLPVLEDGKLVGLLRLSDIVKWLHVHQEMG